MMRQRISEAVRIIQDSIQNEEYQRKVKIQMFD